MTDDNGGFLQVKSVWFSGKHIDYERWAFKFLMVAQVIGFKTILLGTEIAPSPTEVLDYVKLMTMQTHIYLLLLNKMMMSVLVHFTIQMEMHTLLGRI